MECDYKSSASIPYGDYTPAWTDTSDKISVAR